MSSLQKKVIAKIEEKILDIMAEFEVALYINYNINTIKYIQKIATNEGFLIYTYTMMIMMMHVIAEILIHVVVCQPNSFKSK